MKPLQLLSTACLLAVLPLATIGCGSKSSMTGVYTGTGVTVTFREDNKATVTIANTPVDATDTVDGNKVTITPSSGSTPPMVFTINDDGTLTGSGGLTLKKQ